jgi:hypothetical protein
MKQIELFAGIGGFGLAGEWAGIETVCQVEIDPFCQKVLQKNFPNAQRHSDIKTFDGHPFRGTVDLVSGGFPCQPYSTAGKRAGNDDDRALWPEMLRVIGEVAAGVYSPVLSLTWKVSGIRSKHLLFRLVPLARPTGEIVSGLLPTATTSNGTGVGEHGEGGVNLQTKISLLPTPLAGDAEGGRTTKGKGRQAEAGLRQVVQNLLPTPRANDAEKRGQIANDPRNGLPATIMHLIPTPRAEGFDAGKHKGKADSVHSLIKMLPTPTARDWKSEKASPETMAKNARPLSETLGANTGYKLQPEFVEWMMGFPENWTEVND